MGVLDGGCIWLDIVDHWYRQIVSLESEFIESHCNLQVPAAKTVVVKVTVPHDELSLGSARFLTLLL